MYLCRHIFTCVRFQRASSLNFFSHDLLNSAACAYHVRGLFLSPFCLHFCLRTNIKVLCAFSFSDCNTSTRLFSFLHAVKLILIFSLSRARNFLSKSGEDFSIKFSRCVDSRSRKTARIFCGDFFVVKFASDD